MPEKKTVHTEPKTTPNKETQVVTNKKVTKPQITLELAKYYVHEKGFSVIPIKKKGKQPSIPSWKKYQTEKPTDGDLIMWFGIEALNNIAIVTGEISNLLVIDIDSDEGRRFIEERDFPPTPSVKTNKGLHLYYRYRDSVKGFQARKDLPKIDLRGKGGYVVAPPSIHESGVQYSWIEGHTPDDMEFAELPKEKLELLTQKPAQKSAQSQTPNKNNGHGEAQRVIPEGKRNSTLCSGAGFMRQKGMTEDEIAKELLRVNKNYCLPPLPEDEVRKIAKSVAKYPPGTSQHVKNFTDLGNAERLVEQHGKDLRYCFFWKKWFYWNGKRWQEDTTHEEVMRRAKQTSRAIRHKV